MLINLDPAGSYGSLRQEKFRLFQVIGSGMRKRKAKNRPQMNVIS